MDKITSTARVTIIKGKTPLICNLDRIANRLNKEHIKETTLMKKWALLYAGLLGIDTPDENAHIDLTEDSLSEDSLSEEEDPSDEDSESGEDELTVSENSSQDSSGESSDEEDSLSSSSDTDDDSRDSCISDEQEEGWD